MVERKNKVVRVWDYYWHHDGLSYDYVPRGQGNVGFDCF